MKQAVRKLVPLTALAIVLITVSPLAFASTLTVNLNPTTRVAVVDSVSTTKIVFTYPVNSSVSNYLKSMNSSYSLKGSFDGTTSGAHELQGSFDDEDSRVTVQNMSVSTSFSAKGSATSLVIDKTTNITATVSGVFTVVNGTVIADLGWRAFVIRGALNLPLGGRDVDVNLQGSAMENSLGTHFGEAAFLQSYAGAWWSRPTLNFSQLDTPLSTWTKNYDSATSTTTFSKTITGSSNFTSSLDYNGQKYSLSAVSDPSGVVTVQGYANAVGNSLQMAQAPAASSASVLSVAAVVVVLVAAVGYMAYRSRAKAKALTSASTTLPA